MLCKLFVDVNGFLFSFILFQVSNYNKEEIQEIWKDTRSINFLKNRCQGLNYVTSDNSWNQFITKQQTPSKKIKWEK